MSISPWARARTVGVIALAFIAGILLAMKPDRRDWQRSEQWTKITTVEDVASGVRTVVQEQSGSTETRTNPSTPNAPGTTLFGSGSGERDGK